MNRVVILIALLTSLTACQSRGADAPGLAPVAEQKVGKLPHVEFDTKNKQVRVECEMLAVDAPLEFFCCVKGTNDYEAMIRSQVKPSDLHLAMLAIGLKPGQPLQYSEATKRWIPPQGPPLQITMEYEKDGKVVSVPGWKWMRDAKTKKTAPAFTWVFTGSRVMPDGKYAADVTGYLISIVNFDLTVIDIPLLASSSNDLLEWERNPDITPPAGTKVTMVIEPAGFEHRNAEAVPTTQPVAAQPSVAIASSPVGPANVDAELRAAENVALQARKVWGDSVSKHRDAMREAAEAHYKIMQSLRTQQQKLIDEADRMQKTIDDLEKEYQDLTTPRPGSDSK
jgi:hypothetical protein